MSRGARFARGFVDELAALRFSDVFNPYAETCPVYDRAGAPAVRRENLRKVLQAAAADGVDSIWVGLELGRAGGRRTGLPMTDDERLQAHGSLFGIGALVQPTREGPSSEITSAAVWEAIGMIERRVLLWNVFPLHPHKPGNPLSNRRHSRSERVAGLPLFDRLWAELRPRSVLGIGRDAQAALAARGYEFAAVRHPAYGGKREFLSAVCRHYEV